MSWTCFELRDGNVNLATGSDLTIEAGKSSSSDINLVIEGSIVGPSTGTPVDISITNESTGTDSKIILNSDSSKTTGTGINDVTLSATKVELYGNITTVVNSSESGDVSITGATTLKDDVAIDTSSSNGTITFSSTVDGAKNLDLLSGTGKVDIVVDLGAGTAVTTLDINATGGTGTIEINDIGTGSNAGVTGLTVLGNAGTLTITELIISLVVVLQLDQITPWSHLL